MKKLLIGLTLLGSFTTFATESGQICGKLKMISYGEFKSDYDTSNNPVEYFITTKEGVKVKLVERGLKKIYEMKREYKPLASEYDKESKMLFFEDKNITVCGQGTISVVDNSDVEIE